MPTRIYIPKGWLTRVPNKPASPQRGHQALEATQARSPVSRYNVSRGGLLAEMSQVAPGWLSGYARVVLLVVVALNLAQILPRNAYGLVLPPMREGLGLTYSQGGALMTATAFTNMAAFLVFGILVARHGSRYIAAAMGLLSGVAIILMGASPNFLIALLMSGISGFAAGGSIVASVALLSVWFESRHRGAAAGLAVAGGGFGFLIMGVAAPWLTGRFPENGWRYSWYFVGAIQMATGLLALALIRDRPRDALAPTRGWAEGLIVASKNPIVWLMAFLAFLSTWCNSSYTTFFGVYLEEQGVDLVVSGRLWMLLGVFGIASSIFWGSMSDRFGRRSAFFFSALVLGVGCVLFWLIPVMAGFLASAILVGASLRAAYTITAAAAGDYVPPEYAAASFGLIGMGAGLGGSVGPLLAGYLADVTGDLGLIFAMAAAVASVVAVSSTLLHRPKLVSSSP